jgi:hypothetical protein
MKTKDVYVCPLGKFRALPGSQEYNVNPTEQCIACDFSDLSNGRKLEDMCCCPESLTLCAYQRLKDDYEAAPREHTKQGFLKFVEENYQL